MSDIEKDGQKQDDNSTNSNSENDFKELDNEIDKVVRGETSFEEEKINYISDEDSTPNKKNIQIYSHSQKNNEKITNSDINNNLNKIKLLNYLYQLQKENIFALEQYKKNLLISLINSDNHFNNFQNDLNFNNIQNNPNINGFINNINQNELRNNNINNSYNYNNMNNNDINSNISQNMINSYLNELISLYNNSFNNCNNNINDINFFNSNGRINCNNNVNNILKTFNNYNLNETHENILFNNNKLNIFPNLCNNNFNNNYMNNNHNFDSLTPINLKMNLLKHSNIYNDTNQNLFLLNQINNKNKFNVNNNLENNINSQIDLNFFNINNININNRNKSNYENFQKKNNNYNSLSNKNIQKKNSNNMEENNTNNSHKKKSSNQKSDLDTSKNIINLFEVFLCKDRRTTLMIKNIPNKYTISSFLEEININFKFTYDIFYLPIDYVNKCNLGFAFINFVEPFHIILFYELYRGKKWKKFNSDKICELLYAKFQGKKELITHFEKGKVLSMESEEKRPLILPTPNPLPRISLPLYYLELFIKIYPNISYEIKECKYNKKNNNNGCKKKSSSILPIFTIKGNFLSK